MTYEAVKARLDGMRACPRPVQHRAYQEPTQWADLFISESLDPRDRIHYERCGLCAGFLRYLPNPHGRSNHQP